MARNRGDRAGDWENLGTSHLDLERSRPIEHGLRRGLGRFSARGSRWGMTGWSSATLVLLLALAAILTVRGFSRLELPPPLAHPLLPILLVALILFSALRSYTLSLRALAFSRRFVRPGLRNLLEREAETLSRGEKLFRGHRSVVLKIDVEGFTFLTHDMPYGMRRLFVDLWYTLVDEVVARDVFFDKSLGDGSLYCFDAEERPHAARAALEAALRIRDTTVPRFDRVFRARPARRVQRLASSRRGVFRALSAARRDELLGPFHLGAHRPGQRPRRRGPLGPERPEPLRRPGPAGDPGVASRAVGRQRRDRGRRGVRRSPRG
jgi:hypothetical protein